MGLTWREHQAGVRAGEWSAYPGGKRAWDAENKQRYKETLAAGNVFDVKTRSYLKPKEKAPPQKSVSQKKAPSPKSSAPSLRRSAPSPKSSALKKRPTEFDKLLEKDIKTKTIKAKKEKERKAKKEKLEKRFIRKSLKKTQKVAVKIEKKIGRKIKGLQKRPLVSKKVVRKAPRATLDLRRHEREPLKQHGFKEMEISNSNFLFN